MQKEIICFKCKSTNLTLLKDKMYYCNNCKAKFIPYFLSGLSNTSSGNITTPSESSLSKSDSDKS